jgi:hypothetical protein
MKRILTLLAIAALTGCGTLIPKQVEFFQKKVQAFPEKTEKQKETERQAADLAADRAYATVLAAALEHSSPAVTEPAQDTKVLTEAVSQSLGPPISKYEGPVTNLAAKVESNQAKYNEKVTDFARQDNKLEGKKVEGTGLIRIPYFVYIGGIALVIFIAWSVLKLYGSINPAVGVGVNSVGRIASSVLARSYQEIVAGGEAFKDYVEKSELSKEVQTKVLDLFSRAHKENQSPDTQTTVQTLTR